MAVKSDQVGVTAGRGVHPVLAAPHFDGVGWQVGDVASGVMQDALGARLGAISSVSKTRLRSRRLSPPTSSTCSTSISEQALASPVLDTIRGNASRSPVARDEWTRIRRGQGVAAGNRAGPERAHLGDEAKSALTPRLDERRARRVVSERAAQVADRLAERVRGDRDIGPDGIEQLLAAHQSTRTLQEMPQRGPGLRAQRDRHAVLGQPTGAMIHGEAAEGDSALPLVAEAPPCLEDGHRRAAYHA